MFTQIKQICWLASDLHFGHFTMQAAALAEFRADWATAARMYATAYAELLKCGVDGAHPLQRHFEIAACAELFHVKVKAWHDCSPA